mmetsp:Transcript_10819/g.24437  ORF Transcript_10819/g.24437 Transcript_10819/m.24437 type:complete len:198 (-) Transcript_10819:1746-2339(-)
MHARMKGVFVFVSSGQLKMRLFDIRRGEHEPVFRGADRCGVGGMSRGVCGLEGQMKSSHVGCAFSAAAAAAAGAAAAGAESLITVRVYAKEISTSPNHTNVDTTNDCPLCEALVNKCEKFMQAVAYDPASRLNQANLEIVRLPNEHPKAINTPFITICLGNSQEEIQVDRPSPRASAQQVQKVVEKAVLAAAAAAQQ